MPKNLAKVSLAVNPCIYALVFSAVNARGSLTNLEMALSSVTLLTASNSSRLRVTGGLGSSASIKATINGNRAYLGLYTVQDSNGAAIPLVAAFIEYRQQLYEILGPMSNTARYRTTLETAIRSFDRLTNQRILSMQPDHLRIYTARQGDTLQSLADRYGNPRVTVDDLALLNRLAATQTLAAGRLIKVVEKGY